MHLPPRAIRFRLGTFLGRSFAPATLLLVLTGVPARADQTPASDSAKPVAAPEAADLSVFDKKAPESLDDLRAMQAQVQRVVKKVSPCTVAVRVGAGQGSGVIISKDGYVMTAGHVSGKPGRKVTFVFPDGSTAAGITLGRNQGVDAGLMKITDEGEWPFAERGASDDLKPGQWCISIGHPGGFQKDRDPVVRLGRVIQVSRGVIRTDCTLVGGDSGGPLFDIEGRVIGIHSRISRSLTANFHVPVDIYTATWDRLAASEEWGGPPTGPIIGIRGEDHDDGCRVLDVYPDLPAATAGVEEGDVITKVGDQPVKGLAGLIAILNKKKAGEEVTLEIQRGDETLTLKTKLAPRRRPPRRRPPRPRP